MNLAELTGVRATVSGSFRRHIRQIQDDVGMLTDLGVHVLSPSEPRVVDAFGNFLFVASDINRNVRRLQARHMEAIRHSRFLWVTCPDGQVGVSTAMEIGVAAASGIPIHTMTPPADLMLRQFVNCVSSPADALALHIELSVERYAPSLLLDPAWGADSLHRVTDGLQRHLEQHNLSYSADDPMVAALAKAGRRALSGL